MAFGFFIPDVSLFASFSAWRKNSLIFAELYVMHYAHFPAPPPPLYLKIDMCPPTAWFSAHLSDSNVKQIRSHTHFFVFLFLNAEDFYILQFWKELTASGSTCVNQKCQQGFTAHTGDEDPNHRDAIFNKTEFCRLLRKYWQDLCILTLKM